MKPHIDAALALLRVVLGIVFMAHGAQKLFTYGVAGVAQGFAGMGIPLPEVAAWVVTLVEFGGGIALILGLLTRLVALALAIDMLVATIVAHLPKGFFLPEGFEFTFTLGGMAVALLLAGPGRWSLDALIARHRSGRGGERTA